MSIVHFVIFIPMLEQLILPQYQQPSGVVRVIQNNSCTCRYVFYSSGG